MLCARLSIVRRPSSSCEASPGWLPWALFQYVDDTTGICMAGEFISEPYCGEDWSGKGRETFYMDMSIRQASDPDKFVILKSADLLEEIPDFDWKGGHSGRLLDEESAAKLEKLFEKSLAANADKVWSPKFKVFID